MNIGMNMFEEAEAIRGMIKMCSLSQSEMAKKLGVSQSYVANKLRLLSFEKETREKILGGGLSERHARALLKLLGKRELDCAMEKIIKDRLNVEKSEALIDFLHNGDAAQRIGKKDRLDGIESFKSTLKSSVESLVSIGVDAKRSVSFYGSKTYITISIDEGLS